jgi:hypothetical protein
MSSDSEPVRTPITDVFDLHSVPPRDVEGVVEEYLLEAHAAGFKALRIIGAGWRLISAVPPGKQVVTPDQRHNSAGSIRRPSATASARACAPLRNPAIETGTQRFSTGEVALVDTMSWSVGSSPAQVAYITEGKINYRTSPSRACYNWIAIRCSTTSSRIVGPALIVPVPSPLSSPSR